MGTYVKAAKTSELPENSAKLVEVDGKNIALLHGADGYYAIANECTHVGGPLCEGSVHAEEVTCPWHGARFNFKTGQAVAGPGRGDLDCYSVRVVDEDIEIEV